MRRQLQHWRRCSWVAVATVSAGSRPTVGEVRVLSKRRRDIQLQIACVSDSELPRVITFGGTAPLIATWLISVTGSKLAPAWFLVAAAVVALVAMLASRETAWGELKDE